jgi:hypothetical protein
MLELPASCRDALTVTRRLDYRILWIDTLCIVQNSAADWTQEALNMVEYYGDAALILFASTAPDSRHGPLGSRNISI